MAKNSNLREFQEAILLKLKGATGQSNTQPHSCLGIVIGTKNFLIHLHHVTEVLQVPPLQAVPLTQPWFLGVANVRGNLYNVSDLAQFMGMSSTAKSVNNRILLLNSTVTLQSAVLIGSLVGLRSVEALKLSSLDYVGDTLYVKKTYTDIDHKEWLELDVDALVQSKEFIKPAIC